MIPYFSLISTPGNLIVWLCGVAFSFTVSTLYLDFTNQEGGWVKRVFHGLIGSSFFIILTWVLIGDSTGWSEPIGLWLRGK